MKYRIFERIRLRIAYPAMVQVDGTRFLADISGRDSIAAAIKIIEEDSQSILIPSIIELGCEYGDKSQYEGVHRSLRKIFNTDRLRVEQGIVCDGNELWKAIVTRDIQKTIKKFGFFSPCVACHQVLHIIRIKIAQHLHVKNVVSGEKELHDGREKINQFSFVLDFYNKIYEAMGIVHHLPARYISSTSEIERIVGRYNPQYVRLRCLFEGNYYHEGTNDLAISKSRIQEYINVYLERKLDEFGDMIDVPCSIID